MFALMFLLDMYLLISFTTWNVGIAIFLAIRILCLLTFIQGEAGKVPKAEELVMALRNHDLFLYFGHGNGMSTPVFSIVI